MGFAFTVYDYGNKPTVYYISDYKVSDIKEIFVNIISGDETDFIMMWDGTIYDFDASKTRTMNFDDGCYSITDKEDIAKWIKFKALKGSRETVSYVRQRKWG